MAINALIANPMTANTGAYAAPILQQQALERWNALRTDPNNALAAGREPQATGQAMQATGDEREILAKTIMAEAGGEGYGGMVAAGEVILNRLKSGAYGKDLHGVIMAPGQFSAWNDVTGYAGGAGAIDMANVRISEDAYRAADALLSGQYTAQTGGALNYYNPAVANPAWGQRRSGGDWTAIGNHLFGTAR